MLSPNNEKSKKWTTGSFPKASPMLGFSFSLLEGGVERGLTGHWCGRDVWWWSGMGVMRDGCDRGWVWWVCDTGSVCYIWDGCDDGCDTGWMWWVCDTGQVCYGMGVIRDGCDTRWVWTGVDGGEDGRWRERDWVWTGVDGGEDGRWSGARRGVDGCGRGWGWKMEGSETGCGTGVWEEDGGERDGVWTGVDGGEDGRWTGARRGVTGVWKEDGGERDVAWTGVDGGAEGTGVDGGVEGRWSVDGCGRGCGRKMEGSETGCDGCGRGWGWKGGSETGCGRWWGWKTEGSETGCGRVWTGVRMEDGGERDGVWTGVGMEDGVSETVWTGVDGGGDGRWRGARWGVDGCGRWWGWKKEGARLGVDECGRWCGRKMEGSEDGVWTGVDGGVEGRWGEAVARMEDGGERDWVWTGVDGGEDGRWRGARRGVDGCGRVRMEDGERDGVWTGVDGVWVEDGGERDGVWTGVDGGKGGSVWVDRVRARSMFQGSSQTCFVVAWNIQEIEVEGVADGDDSGGKGCSRGWTEAVYEACFRVSLKHASLWAEILKKSRLKGLQMEMILAEREVDVSGQQPCTKHVSGLVSNMLCCGVKYSGNWGWGSCRWRWSWRKGG